jgi:hypothetical protein
VTLLDDVIVGAHSVLGGEGDDVVHARSGLIDGGTGNDTLSTAYGALNGGADDDVLTATLPVDPLAVARSYDGTIQPVLTGGSGDDAFEVDLYTSLRPEEDVIERLIRITDFMPGEDSLSFRDFPEGSVDLTLTEASDGSYTDVAFIVTTDADGSVVDRGTIRLEGVTGLTPEQLSVSA